MRNVFEKKIPKTLDECIKPDEVSTNLLLWAERIKKWGSTLLTIVIVLGLIFTAYEAIITYNELEALTGDDEAASAAFFAAITTLFTYIIYSFIVYVTYQVIALLICALSKIVHNTNISANLAIYSVKGKDGDKFTEISETENFRRNDAPTHYDSKIPTASKDSGNNSCGEESEENYIDTECPLCGQKFSFPEGTKTAVCPWCGAQFEI